MKLSQRSDSEETRPSWLRAALTHGRMLAVESTVLGVSRMLGRLGAEGRDRASTPVAGLVSAITPRAKKRLIAADLMRVAGDDSPIGPRRDLLRDHFRSSARMILDDLWVWTAKPPELDEFLSHTDIEPIRKAWEDAGRLIIVSPHISAIRLPFLQMAAKGLPMTGLVRVEPGVLQRLATKHTHDRFGAELVRTGAGRKGVIKNLASALDAGRIVAMNSDVPNGATMDLPWAGARRLIGLGPAILAERTGAPIVCWAPYQDGSRRTMVTKAPIDPLHFHNRPDPVEAITRQIARDTGDLISMAPAQWRHAGYAALLAPRQFDGAAKTGALVETKSLERLGADERDAVPPLGMSFELPDAPSRTASTADDFGSLSINFQITKDA
jgi:lauroyl/myristoyl acyltransferase